MRWLGCDLRTRHNTNIVVVKKGSTPGGARPRGKMMYSILDNFRQLGIISVRNVREWTWMAILDQGRLHALVVPMKKKKYIISFVEIIDTIDIGRHYRSLNLGRCHLGFTIPILRLTTHSSVADVQMISTSAYETSPSTKLFLNSGNRRLNFCWPHNQ